MSIVVAILLRTFVVVFFRECTMSFSYNDTLKKNEAEYVLQESIRS